MTPAERAVLDAARAYVAAWADSARHYHGPEAERLNAAVRALPRPLSEQLAELRPGAVVEDEDGDEVTVLCIDRESGTYFWKIGGGDDQAITGCGLIQSIARIISNPEESNG